MYEPAPFRVEERSELVAFLRAHPLGLLIAEGEQGISADLIPFLVDDAGDRLRAHFARANPLLQALTKSGRVLVVFCGPQAYISPSHYPSKAEHGRVVPTWNFTMVQAQGQAFLREEPEWIGRQIADLTMQQEAGRPAPWAPADAPKDFIVARISAIVGLEVRISDLRGKYKLSQNRSEQDRRGVMDGLAEEHSVDAQAVAEMMRLKPTDGPEAQ